MQSNAQSCDLDLGFVIYACQGTNEVTDYNESIEFMRSVTKSFTIGFNRTRVALVASCYSSNRLEFDFEDGTSKNRLFFNYILSQMLMKEGRIIVIDELCDIRINYRVIWTLKGLLDRLQYTLSALFKPA